MSRRRTVSTFLASGAVLALLVGSQASGQTRLVGSVEIEGRVFAEPGLYGNRSQGELALRLEPELSYSWDQGRRVVVVAPYAVVSDTDEERSHIDLREAAFIGAFGPLELRLGISRVFWGVTESQHLVDVVNQTDLVESPDGEVKLGQPMINPTVSTRAGNFSLFLLPYFRERTFPGRRGRLRGPLPVVTGDPLYESSRREHHLDYALRWSRAFRSLDLGLSLFDGTDREPSLVQVDGLLRPRYGQVLQAGLDAQLLRGASSWKLEAILKNRSRGPSLRALVAGIEHTVYNLGHRTRSFDLGLLYELSLAGGGTAATPFEEHSFLGARLALQDTSGGELLVGAFYSHRRGAFDALRLEGSRRLNGGWKLDLEASVFLASEPANPLANLRADDHLKLSLAYYW